MASFAERLKEAVESVDSQVSVVTRFAQALVVAAGKEVGLKICHLLQEAAILPEIPSIDDDLNSKNFKRMMTPEECVTRIRIMCSMVRVGLLPKGEPKDEFGPLFGYLSKNTKVLRILSESLVLLLWHGLHHTEKPHEKFGLLLIPKENLLADIRVDLAKEKQQAQRQGRRQTLSENSRGGSFVGMAVTQPEIFREITAFDLAKYGLLCDKNGSKHQDNYCHICCALTQFWEKVSYEP